MTRDEPCTGSEGVATPYGREDTWPQWDLTWQNHGGPVDPADVQLLCSADALTVGEVRDQALIRRLS